MADLGLSTAFGLSLQSRTGGSRDQKRAFCNGIPIADSVAGLHGKFGSQNNLSTDMSPPGTGRTTGNSTPSPPWMGGSYAHSMHSLSSGQATPPEQTLLQHLIDSLDGSSARKLPLKPGLLDGPKASWPLPVRPPPGLSPPLLPRDVTPPTTLMRASVLPPHVPQLPAAAPAPAPTPVAAPVPPPPPSLGSVGHPDVCAEACKYVKRKTGCSQGADCPNCHQCFWRHRRVTRAEVDSICSTAYSGGGKGSDGETEKTLVQESLGSANHPSGCTTPCKYVKRKGGCRSGASCPDCHLCHWRRNEPQAASKPVGLSEETGPGFSRKATTRLQNLIRIQLDTTAAKSTPATDELEPASPEPISSAFEPLSAGVDAPDAHLETPDDVFRLVGPAPGLEGRHLFFTQGQGPFLLGGHLAPR